MELDTMRPVEDLRPLARDTDAEQVAHLAYDRLLATLEGLPRASWSRPTECEGWDVAAMVGHLIGAARSCASVRELIRQQLWAKRHASEFDGNALDAANELQVREHADLTIEARIDELRRLAPAAVRGRMRLPSPLRRLRIPLDQGGSTAAGMPTRFTLGELMDVVYTRDTWLHAVDIARATGTDLPPAEHLDRRLVEDAVRAWCRRHGRPVTLTLTGPAGGRFRTAGDGVGLELDAVEFCRVLSGRAEPDDVVVPGTSADARDLLRTRLVF